MINGITQAFNATLNFVQQVFDVVEEVFNKIKATFQDIFEWIAWFFETISAGVINTQKVISYYLGSIPNYLASVIQNQGKEIVASTFTSLKNNFDSNFNSMKEQVKSMAVNAENTFSSILDSVTSSALWLWNKIKNFAGSIFSSFSRKLRHRGSSSSSQPIDTLSQKVTAFAGTPAYSQAESSTDSYLQNSFANEGSILASTLDTVLSGIQAAIDGIINFLNDLVQSTLDAAANGLSEFGALINHEFEIPLISWIYKQLTGDTLSVSINSIFSLALAIPTFIVHEIVYQKAPFSDSDVHTILSNPAFPQLSGNSKSLATTTDMQKAFGTIAGVATLVNIVGDAGLDVSPSPTYLWITTIASAVQTCFRVPTSDFGNAWRWAPWAVSWVPQAISWCCIGYSSGAKGIRGYDWGMLMISHISSKNNNWYNQNNNKHQVDGSFAFGDWSKWGSIAQQTT